MRYSLPLANSDDCANIVSFLNDSDFTRTGDHFIEFTTGNIVHCVEFTEDTIVPADATQIEIFVPLDNNNKLYIYPEGPDAIKFMPFPYKG